MATNGDNSNKGNIQFTSKSKPEKGLSGYFQGQDLKTQFSEKYFQEGGYLSTALSELQEMEKEYSSIANLVEGMSKTERDRFNAQNQALKNQITVLTRIQDNQSATDKEAIKSIKDSNKLRINGMVEYQKLLLKASDINSTSTKAEKKAAAERLKFLQSYSIVAAEVESRLNGVNNELDDAGRALKDAADDFSSSLFDSIDNLKTKARDFLNMFNLNTIANSAMEQNARSKLSIVNNTSKLFGFNSNSQFESFKNSLNNTLKDMNREMGDIFNSSDMKEYLSQLSAYGITNSKMAEQQFRSSVIATKYLGTSAETQAAMFKYLKRTNNNEVLNDHNKMIVGLLKSQLGVSKDQLDLLSKQTYSDVDALAALGLDEEGQQRYIDEATASKTAVSSINEGWGTLLGNIFNEMISMPYSQMIQKYAKIFGGDTMSIYNELMKGNAKNATNLIVNSSYARNTLSGMSSAALSESANAMGIDYNTLNMLKYFGNANNSSDLMNKISDALDNINSTTDKEVSDYVKDTTNTTFLERMLNKLDTSFNGLPWKSYLVLANLAFAAYLGSPLLKGGKKILDGFKPDGFIGKIFSSSKNQDQQLSLFNSGKTKAGSGLSGLATGVAVIGLTAAAIHGIAEATRSGLVNETTNNKESAQKTLKSSGNSLANNSSYSTAYSSGMLNEQQNFGSTIGNFIKGMALGVEDSFISLFSSSPQKKLKSMFDSWENGNRILGKGGRSAAENAVYAMTFASIMDEYGYLKSVLGERGYSSADIKSWYNSKDFDNDAFLKAINFWFSNPRYNVTQYNKNMTRQDYANRLRKTLGQGGPADGGFVPTSHYGMGGDSNSLTSIVHSPWYRVTSMWGSRPNPFGGNSMEDHGGIDISAPSGTPIGSAVDGTVYTAGWVSGFGNAVYILGNNGKKYIYGHMVTTPLVSTGDSVKAGQTIGYVGSTGRSTGSHLHFQVGNTWTKSGSVDPVPYLNTGVLYPGTSSIKGVVGYNSTKSNNISSTSTPVIKSPRFIPKAFSSSTGGQGGSDGVSRITNSVDGGINRLISYLDSIREEQNNQRAILNAFAKANSSNSAY